MQNYSGKIVVPNTLSGFRQIIFAKERFISPQQLYEWKPSENIASCFCNVVVRATGECSTCANHFIGSRQRVCGPFTAITICIHDKYKYNKQVAVTLTTQPSHSDPAPQLDCWCGFYATYKYSELVDNAPGIDWIPRLVGNDWLTSTNYSLPFVAYVQAYGRIVIGTRGFRAERMDIIALSPYHHFPYALECVGGKLTRLGDVPIISLSEMQSMQADDVSGLLD